MPSALDTRPDNSTALDQWNDQEIELIKAVVAPGCTDAELALFATVCEHRQLDPFAGEIVGIMRWDGKARREVMKIQVTIEGLRVLADRTGLYAGQDEAVWCGRNHVWTDVWDDADAPPVAAKVLVYRHGWERPAVGKVHYAELVQLDKEGKPTPTWRKMPALLLAKCAERQGIIRAFKRQLEEAGVSFRDLSPAQRLSMEARQIGLDDNGRHALVADVTRGRTESTRELTQGEHLAVRRRLAQIQDEEMAMAGPSSGPPPGVDPETGEITPRPAAPTLPGAGEGTKPEGVNPPTPGPVETEPRPAAPPPDPSVGPVESPSALAGESTGPTSDNVEEPEAPRPLATAAGPHDQAVTVDTETGERLDPTEAEHWRMVNEVLRRVQMLAKAPNPGPYVAYQKWAHEAGLDGGKRAQHSTVGELQKILDHFAELDAQAAAETAALEEPF